MNQGVDHRIRHVTYAEVCAIPGWMTRADFSAFQFVLSTQAETESRGALAELGVYLGKSAVVIGGSCRDGEQFTVVDLFEDTATDRANALEITREYRGLSRRQFEANYISVHSTLPNVVQGPSRSVLGVAPHGAHRFVHIDASHLYDHVREDLAAAHVLLRPDGVVVLDDYRSVHTPGVAAAVWAAVEKGLRPFLLTTNKLYGTWGDADRWATALQSWLPRTSFEHEVQSIAGCNVRRIWSPTSAVARWMPSAAAPLARALRARLLSRCGRP